LPAYYGEGQVAVKGDGAPKHHFLAQLLLPLNLRQQKFLPAFGTVNIGGTELGRPTISVPVEQQQRVVTGRF
jgi:hypothetical protein